MTLFLTTEPFEIPIVPRRLGGRKVDVPGLKEFWHTTDILAHQRGCYVFSIRAGKGEKPWYVGKASRQSLAEECFALHKLKIYDDILGERKGTPRLTFVVPQRTRGNWPMQAIDEVEEFLIGHAASRNADLANKRRLPNQTWSIRGVAPMTRGAPTLNGNSFKRLMGI
jgi:hypothetical protein